MEIFSGITSSAKTGLHTATRLVNTPLSPRSELVRTGLMQHRGTVRLPGPVENRDSRLLFADVRGRRAWRKLTQPQIDNTRIVLIHYIRSAARDR